MEIVLSLAIGVLSASGIWLILRPRSFQVIVGLCLLSYAVNLFIFSMGRLTIGAPAIMPKGGFVNPDAYADPIPQALVLTAIVIKQHQRAGDEGDQDRGDDQVLAHGCSLSRPSTWSVPVNPREAISTTRNSAVVAKLMTMAVRTSAWGSGSA